MSGRFVGPMPIDQFMADFLSPKSTTMPIPDLPDVDGKLFSGLPEIKKGVTENNLYDPFIKFITDAGIIPGFKIVNTANSPDLDSRAGRKFKPDPTMYKEGVDTNTRKTQFGEMELHFEFKAKKALDPFNDPPSGTTAEERLSWTFESRTDLGRETRGQVCSYVREWMARQHRKFAFSVFVADPCVRFIRWDRSGATVSESFDYREDSVPLLRFLWHFAHLDDADRGLDTTVRKANTEEKELAEEHLTRWKPTMTRESVVFTINDNGEKREFIGWGSMAEPDSIVGRATRAYPVYEEATQKVCFLKDVWRAHSLQAESKILKTLKDNEVENVPTFICGDDIDGQTTLTDLYGPPPPNAAQARRESSWRCGDRFKPIVQRIHHRFVVDVVGQPLANFKSSKQLLKVVLDAFIAHQQAYNKCRVIHRDISINNILIVEEEKGEVRGILNDWDLAKFEADICSGGPRDHERTGTWQFISILLLKQPTKPHTIQDDIESFIYVILYLSLLFLKHNKPHRVNRIMQQVFDLNWKQGDIYIGGEGKSAMFALWEYIDRDFNFTSNTPMTDWLRHVIRAGRDWLDWVGDTMPSATVPASGTAPSTPVTAPIPVNSGLLFENHDAFISKWRELLDKSDWPSLGEDREVNKVGYIVSRRLPAVVSSTGTTGSGKRSRQNSLAKNDDEEWTPPNAKRAKVASGQSGQPSMLRQSFGVESDEI